MSHGENILHQNRLAQVDDNLEKAKSPELPVANLNTERSGCCIITADNADGTYDVTEVIWDASAGDWVELAAPNYVDEEAQEISGSTAGSVDDIVRFWTETADDGATKLFIEVAPAGGGGTRSG